MNETSNKKKTNHKTLASAGVLFLMLLSGGGIRQVGYAFDNAATKEVSPDQNQSDDASSQNAHSSSQKPLYYLPF